MATITITYTKPVAASVTPVAQICATFVPTNAAADNSSVTGGIPGSYYDTNVEGYGECMSAMEFFFKQIAHPGLIAALRAAMRDYEADQKKAEPTGHGTYAWTATDADALYVEELKPALADQGFTFAVA